MTKKFSVHVFFGGYSTVENTEDGPVERWVETFQIGATDGRGRNYFLADFAAETEMEAASMLLALADSDPDNSPDAWVEGEPSYGSEAWGPENEYALAC